MEISLAVPLLVVNVRMVCVVVAIPAVVVTPVPVITPHILASMLPAMIPLVLSRMAGFAERVAPVETPITIVVLDDYPAVIWGITRALMFRIHRCYTGSCKRNNNANLNKKFFHFYLNVVKVERQ